MISFHHLGGLLLGEGAALCDRGYGFLDHSVPSVVRKDWIPAFAGMTDEHPRPVSSTGQGGFETRPYDTIGRHCLSSSQ